MINLNPIDLKEGNPLILFPWNDCSSPASAFKLIEMIENYGGKICKLNFMDPEINCTALKIEVESIASRLNKTKSIAKKILTEAKDGDYPEINKIMEKVKAAMANVQGLLLPGGGDVRPLFYGEKIEAKTEQTNDFRRDVFEFSMLYEADIKNIPVFGICRGLQITNVWYGGSLIQHIEGHHYVLQKYCLIKNCNEMHPESVINKVFEHANDSLTGYSNHHQAVDKVGENLSVMSETEDGVVKALESLKNRFIVLVQWHPERIRFTSNPEEKEIASEMSPENFQLFEHFVNAAKAQLKVQNL